MCANTQDRGCGALALAAAQAKTHQKISPVGAGFLGAGLTVAVLAMALGVLAFLGVLVLGRRSRRAVQASPTEKKQQVSARAAVTLHCGTRRRRRLDPNFFF